ncbi:MAG: 3-isopropylmalate dehydratase large subunit [Candidatus Omnitrophota bacterium]|nr:MAG: 3-isopropylmalate dehydratase large subunit [Candidatus Omnitrophota bacterium]
MNLTLAEKILLAHTDKEEISAGEFVLADVDLCLGNDITAPIAIKEFEELAPERRRLFDRRKIVLVPDHFTPNKDIKSAQQCKLMREFAKKYGIENYFEIGRMGIEHALLPELGFIKPGDLVIGADSHTCTYGALGAFSTGVGSTDLSFAFATGKCWFKVPETIRFIYYGQLRKWVGGKDIILYTIGDIGVSGCLYKAMEFSGEAIEGLGMDERFTICNMAIEAGGKCGMIEADEVTYRYIKQSKGGKEIKGIERWKADKGARYSEVREYDVSKLKPLVACPHLPSNVKPAEELADVRLDQVVIGSCTNGRLSDLRISAEILKGKKVHPDLRLIIIPATQRIYLEALREGLIEVFIEANAVVSTPTCGPCLGGHMGVLAEGEKVLATTNRNFKGRMGHPESEIYLASPAVAAASAIKGRIAIPEEV